MTPTGRRPVLVGRIEAGERPKHSVRVVRRASMEYLCRVAWGRGR